MQNYLIAGLGNIGDEYIDTRHNIGFYVLDTFAQKEGLVFESARYSFKCEYKLKNKLIHFIKPTTFMNLSGKAVKYWMEKEKISIENILVIVDDIALPLNKLRLRAGGSDAGHNGLKSLQEILGTSEYPKLRFGIGNDFPKGHQSDFVLGKWNKEEEPLVKLKIEKSVESIESFVVQGITAAMNQVNNQDFSL